MDSLSKLVGVGPCIVLCAAVALSASGGTAHADAIAHWSFNTPTTDGSGNVLSYPDDSGNGYTATVVNNGAGTSIGEATTGLQNFTGYDNTGAAQFNNNNETSGTANGSYLSIPLLPGIESASASSNTATSFSVSAWMKLPADWASSSTNKLYAPVLTDWATPTATANSFLMFVGYDNTTNVNDMYADIANNTGTTMINHYETTASLSIDAWHNVVWTWSGSSDLTTGTVAMYLDGAQKYTQTYTAPAGGNTAVRSSGASTMEIGFKTNGGQILSGGLDELYIFDNALSQDDVSSLYATNAVSAVPEPASLSLLALGAVGLLSRRRRRSTER